MDIIATYPSVVYRVTLTNNEVKEIDNPAFLPEPTYIEKIEEPMVQAFVICPNEYIGDMMALITEKRGIHRSHRDARFQARDAHEPFASERILIDFHDRIKSMTRGFGSMDYEHAGYKESANGQTRHARQWRVGRCVSCIVHRDKAEGRGRALAAKLKSHSRQQYQVAIQAAIGGKVVARETVSALRKDVTAKCYGGDITRKTQAPRKTKRRQKADEVLRFGQHSARSIHRSAQDLSLIA